MNASFEYEILNNFKLGEKVLINILVFIEFDSK